MVELVCLAIVLVYVVVRARTDASPRAFGLRLSLLALSSFVAEDSVIHAYAFYGYAPRWNVFLDRVPLMIVLIWPVVIHSAWDLARRLSSAGWKTALLGMMVVLFDASLIEPVAVNAGFWSWSEPGLFLVPPIGVLGWGIFAGFAMLVLERGRLWMLSLAVLGTHAVLIAVWWGLFRWINVALPALPAVVALWVFTTALASYVRRAELQRRVPVLEMLLRIPGALFFFVMLAVGRAEYLLVAYTFAFAPPYLALTDFRALPVLLSGRRGNIDRGEKSVAPRT